jgi:hypothetical protein
MTVGPMMPSIESAQEAWNKREPDWEWKWGELVETVSARTDQAKLDQFTKAILAVPPEPFCSRYPGLGHPVGDDNVCISCGKKVE